MKMNQVNSNTLHLTLRVESETRDIHILNPPPLSAVRLQFEGTGGYYLNIQGDSPINHDCSHNLEYKSDEYNFKDVNNSRQVVIHFGKPMNCTKSSSKELGGNQSYPSQPMESLSTSQDKHSTYVNTIESDSSDQSLERNVTGSGSAEGEVNETPRGRKSRAKDETSQLIMNLSGSSSSDMNDSSSTVDYNNNQGENSNDLSDSDEIDDHVEGFARFNKRIEMMKLQRATKTRYESYRNTVDCITDEVISLEKRFLYLRKLVVPRNESGSREMDQKRTYHGILRLRDELMQQFLRIKIVHSSISTYLWSVKRTRGEDDDDLINEEFKKLSQLENNISESKNVIINRIRTFDPVCDYLEFELDSADISGRQIEESIAGDKCDHSPSITQADLPANAIGNDSESQATTTLVGTSESFITDDTEDTSRTLVNIEKRESDSISDLEEQVINLKSRLKQISDSQEPGTRNQVVACR